MMTMMNAFSVCPEKRCSKTPKTAGCNDTLRLLIGRTYGILTDMINQLIWMRANFLDSYHLGVHNGCIAFDGCMF